MQSKPTSSVQKTILAALVLMLVTTPPTAGCGDDGVVQNGQDQLQRIACDQLKNVSAKQLDRIFQVAVVEFEKNGVKFDRKVWADSVQFSLLYEKFRDVVNCPEPQPPPLERLSENSPENILLHHESPGPDAFCGPSHGPPGWLDKLPYVSRCLNRACYKHDSCYAKCSEQTGGGEEDCAWTIATKPCDDAFFEEADQCPPEIGTITASLFVITAARALVLSENFDGCKPGTQCPRPEDPGLGVCGKSRSGTACVNCLEKVDPNSSCRLSACIAKEEDDTCYTANCPAVSECFGWGKEDYAGGDGAGGAGGGAGSASQGGNNMGGTGSSGNQAGTGGGSSICENCWGTAMADSGLCASQANACDQSPDCIAFYNCASQCSTNACSQACEQAYPVGSNLYWAVAQCGCSKACPIECANECGGGTAGSSGSGGGGSSGAGGVSCQDYFDEPGATSSSAFTLSSVKDSDGWWTIGGIINSTQDKDWYKFYGMDTFGYEVDPAAYVKESGLTLCIYSKCAYKQSCSYKAVVDDLTGAEGCCIKTPGTVYAATDCDGIDDSTTIYMQVSKPDTPSCIDYTLEYRYGK